jgi:hypothetical protein
MEVFRAELDRAKLAAMPENERVLLLLLAHASNELNVLTKLILMMRKDEPSSPIIDHVEAGQTFILMRLLIGKLHEAWELFRTRVHSDRSIATTLIPRLRPEATAALQELNQHFGKGSPLSAIRNLRRERWPGFVHENYALIFDGSARLSPNLAIRFRIINTPSHDNASCDHRILPSRM